RPPAPDQGKNARVATMSAGLLIDIAYGCRRPHIAMNLRDLRYFVALAETRHFGKAAERSFVSQPTLSAQLKKLENYLGVQLIERQPRRVALTETGAKILPLARRMLEES